MHHKTTWGGVWLASLGLFLLIFPVVAGREANWPAWSLAMLACAIPVGYAFIAYERRQIRAGATPLLALHLLQVPTIQLGLISAAVFFFDLGVFFVVLTVTLQSGHGYSPSQTGLLFLPFAAAFSVAAALSGRVSARLGVGILNLGTALMAVGLLLLLSAFSVELTPGTVAVALAIYGVGQGLAQPALINIVIGGSGISGEDTGAAVGLFLTTAQSCIALGVAVLGDVFTGRRLHWATSSSGASARLPHRRTICRRHRPC